MSRQERRRLERQQQKNNFRLTSQKGPISYGAYYKDDTAEGFNFSILPGEFGDDTQSVINNFISCAEKMYNDSKKWNTSTRLEQIIACRRELREDIKEYNRLVNMPEGRPSGFYPQVSQEAFKVAFMISTSIHFLTMLGDIKNDNYNGMAFMYDDMKVTQVA